MILSQYKIFSVLTVCFTILGVTMTSEVHASHAMRETTQPGKTWTPADKFSRGATNAATGFMEFPLEIQRTTEKTTLFEGWTAGAARGVGLAFARTGAGLYEMATFFIPAPEEYEPVIQPETITSE